MVRTSNLSKAKGVTVWIELYAFDVTPKIIQSGSINVQYAHPHSDVDGDREYYRVPLTNDDLHAISEELKFFYEDVKERPWLEPKLHLKNPSDI